VSVQVVSYWEDATEFPHGPFVAVAAPTWPLRYRLEKRLPSGVGSGPVFPEDTRCLPGYQPGWKSLAEITPIIEALNARVSGAGLTEAGGPPLTLVSPGTPTEPSASPAAETVAVRCPACKAAVGRPCRTLYANPGSLMAGFHPEREAETLGRDGAPQESLTREGEAGGSITRFRSSGVPSVPDAGDDNGRL
jgi:hypothetical protein